MDTNPAVSIYILYMHLPPVIEQNFARFEWSQSHHDLTVVPIIKFYSIHNFLFKGTVKLYFFLLKKMPLVCTRNMTFLFFQSSTYKMLKIATFVYFSVIFLWARHWLHGLGHRKCHLFFPVSEYMGPSPTSRARHCTFKGQGPYLWWRAHEKMTEHYLSML